MKKYYLAYEDRYKKVHAEGLRWFSNKPTPELLEWIKYNNIPINEEICEIGCGEGRDALYLAIQGYKVTAIDASPTAIDKCKQLAVEKKLKINFEVLDALEPNFRINRKFKWIYSIATLHMLAEDEDRRKFLNSLHGLLEPGGKALIVSMGDGDSERRSDITKAFELQERYHPETGRAMMLVGTSYRGVNWEVHENELISAGFEIEKKLNTENDEYAKCMTVYMKKIIGGV